MDVVDWLLDADPSIRWQVMRDLTHEPDGVVAAERARVATEGWGARLLALQGDDGRWGGRRVVARLDGHHCTRSSCCGPGARSGERRRPGGRSSWYMTVSRGRAGTRRTMGRQRVLRRRGRAVHQRRGRSRSAPTSARTSRRWWIGCSASSSPTAAGTARPRTARRVSSFDTTIGVLEGLLEFERATGGVRPRSTAARRRGRGVPAGAPPVPPQVDRRGDRPAWLAVLVPDLAHYDVLRGLDYLRAAGRARSAHRRGHRPRRAQARRRRPLAARARRTRARSHFELDDGEGKPSRWNTLRALRVLDWAAGRRWGPSGNRSSRTGDRGMIEQITAREFREQAGVADWRIGSDRDRIPVPAQGQGPGSGPPLVAEQVLARLEDAVVAVLDGGEGCAVLALRSARLAWQNGHSTTSRWNLR